MLTMKNHQVIISNNQTKNDNRINEKAMNGNSRGIKDFKRAGGWCEPVVFYLRTRPGAAL